MGTDRATSYNVARLAGVSQSAVSRTFTPGGSVSAKTREKVLAAANELGFRPNPIAQSLSFGRSKLVGFVITQYAHQSYPVALRSAIEVLADMGETLLLQIVEYGSKGDDAVARLIYNRVDMIITAADLSVDATKACASNNIPLVAINRCLAVPGVDHIHSDNKGIMRDVTSKLIAKGVHRILFIEADTPSWVSEERKVGVVAGCEAHAVPPPKVLKGDFSYQGGVDAILANDLNWSEFDAIVSANDPMALGAMDAIRFRLGMKVPSDLMVVGHDNSPGGGQMSYDLTSVAQQMVPMVEAAIKLGTERLNDAKRDEVKLVFDSKIISRSSAPLED